MNKKIDISRVLAKGSAKQRALLYFNNIAEINRVVVDPDGTPRRQNKGFLSEHEERQLFESFKTEADIKVYNHFLRLERDLDRKQAGLETMIFRYRETIASLTGYCLLYHGYMEFAETLNAFYYAAETPKEKKKFLAILEERKHYLWAEIGPGKNPERDGIKVNPKTGDTRKAPKIRDILDALSKRAKEQLRECKTGVKILRDTIEENGFKIEALIDHIDNLEKDLKEDKAPLPKFSRKKTEEGLLSYDKDPKHRQQMEEIFGPNWLFPEYEALEIDEELYRLARGSEEWADK